MVHKKVALKKILPKPFFLTTPVPQFRLSTRLCKLESSSWLMIAPFVITNPAVPFVLARHLSSDHLFPPWTSGCGCGWGATLTDCQFPAHLPLSSLSQRTCLSFINGAIYSTFPKLWKFLLEFSWFCYKRCPWRVKENKTWTMWVRQHTASILICVAISLVRNVLC